MSNVYAWRCVMLGVSSLLPSQSFAQMVPGVAPAQPGYAPSAPAVTRPCEPAAAPPLPASAPEVHTSTFVRFHLGYARLRSNFSPYDGSHGSAFGFSIGGTLVQGMALAGVLSFAGNNRTNESVFVGQLGLTLNYYLPENFFAGAGLGWAEGSYQDPESETETLDSGAGAAYNLAFGWEYLFDRSQWGIGPAVQFWYSRFDAGDFIATSVVFSATNH